MFLPHKKFELNIITLKNSVYVICVPFILQQTFLAVLSEMNNQANDSPHFPVQREFGKLNVKKTKHIYPFFSRGYTLENT